MVIPKAPTSHERLIPLARVVDLSRSWQCLLADGAKTLWRMLQWCRKRPTLVSKETYSCVERDLHSVKRDLHSVERDLLYIGVTGQWAA
jgi:hypothetical protein